mgnify:CR=1 FL=1
MLLAVYWAQVLSFILLRFKVATYKTTTHNWYPFVDVSLIPLTRNCGQLIHE